MSSHTLPDNRNRFYYAICALLFAALGAYGLYRLHTENPATWAEIVPQAGQGEAETSTNEIDLTLREASTVEGPKAGAIIPLARFVQVGGKVINVRLIEGSFYPETIEPANVWAGLGKSVLLVSSVDENRSRSGGSSAPISIGCNVKPAIPQQQLGFAALLPCKGPYKEGNINWVGALAVVVENPIGAQSNVCWKKFGIVTQETDYQACISRAVAAALKDLFVVIRKRADVRPDTLVLPFVATGAGRLPKVQFLERFFNDFLLPDLAKTDYIPANIYLQVKRWDGQGPNLWGDTQVALSSKVSESVNNWTNAVHKPADSEWLSLTGVCLGNAILLILHLAGLNITSIRMLAPFMAAPSLLFMFAWTSVALGSTSIFKAALTFFPGELSPLLQVAAGIAAAFICGPLIAMIKRVESAVTTRTENSHVSEIQ